MCVDQSCRQVLKGDHSVFRRPMIRCFPSVGMSHRGRRKGSGMRGSTKILGRQ